MQKSDKILLDIPKHRRIERQHKVADLSNGKLKNVCFSENKHICRKGRNWYDLHSSSLTWAPHHLTTFPLAWINITFLISTSKHFLGAKSFSGTSITGYLWNGLRCWTSDWAAKSIAVKPLAEFRVNAHSMELNVSDLCRQATKAFSLFPTTYRSESVFPKLYL